jgi:hypothetical protein
MNIKGEFLGEEGTSRWGMVKGEGNGEVNMKNNKTKAVVISFTIEMTHFSLLKRYSFPNKFCSFTKKKR